MPLASCGCVAMNIPSVRYHDPDDRGGILGPHRPAGAEDVSTQTVGYCDAGCCGDDGEWPGVGEFAPVGGGCLPLGSEKKPPGVPWPRFHPLPTRPVF